MQRRHVLTLFFDDGFVAQMDKARGNMSRGRFVEWLASLPSKTPELKISREGEEALREIEKEPVLRTASRRRSPS
jgi:hypothetical protein